MDTKREDILEKKREIIKNKNIKKNEIKIEIEDDPKTQIVKKESGVYHDGKRLLYEPDETFKSCCFEVDKDCVYYCGKMIISISVLAFSFLMLQNPANDVAFYTSTISLLLGHFLNTPTTQKENKEKKKD